MRNPTLIIALALSFVAHAVILAIRFIDPEPLPTKPVDPGLEVILVNAKHAKPPKKAQALAQADLDGGGNADDGHSKSPLPDMQKMDDGDAILKTQKRIEELENLQQHLLAQVKNSNSPFKVSNVIDKKKNATEKTLLNGADQTESQKAISRMAAEIAQTIEDQNKRPRKTFLSPATRGVGYAQYYKAMQQRIEKIGTLNFPEKDGQKLYGELIIYIPIFQDGSIYMKEGGPRIEKSSGNKSLDKAALRIVKRSAPFGSFPANMRSSDKDDLWIVITRFTFTREMDLVTEVTGHESE